MEWVCAAAVAVCVYLPSVEVVGNRIDVIIARPDLTHPAMLHVDCEAGTRTVGDLRPGPFEPGSVADRLCNNFVGRPS